VKSTKGTFCLEARTLRRLQEFSNRSGISQSALVDELLSEGLTHLEKNFWPTAVVVRKGYQEANISQRVARRQRGRKVS